MQKQKELKKAILAKEKQWGKWEYDGSRSPLLRIKMPNGVLWYNVILATVATREKVDDWVSHLSGKPWMTVYDVDNFLEAIEDLVTAGLHYVEEKE